MGPIHYRISWETSGPLPRDSSSDHTKEVIGGGVLMSSGANCPHLQVLTTILLAAATPLHLERPTFNNIIHYWSDVKTKKNTTRLWSSEALKSVSFSHCGRIFFEDSFNFLAPFVWIHDFSLLTFNLHTFSYTEKKSWNFTRIKKFKQYFKKDSAALCVDYLKEKKQRMKGSQIPPVIHFSSHWCRIFHEIVFIDSFILDFTTYLFYFEECVKSHRFIKANSRNILP